MDSFEAVVAAILQRQGYWTQTCVKVELTKEEKLEIGLPSCPRWELDIVAYSGKRNELLVVECKSFLDSPGVRCGSFDEPNAKDKKRYKLFFNDKLRDVVLNRLKRQFAEEGFCPSRLKLRFGLAAGKINGDEQKLKKHFRGKRWEFWGPKEISDELRKHREGKYENSIASVVAKLLLRNVATVEVSEKPKPKRTKIK